MSSVHHAEMDARLHAITSLLVEAERSGMRVSSKAQKVIEAECLNLFLHFRGPFNAKQFSAILKQTAVRMFRQRRYREANSRYRMASLFNPSDVTLMSNRATCMYNLGRYSRCIDLCHTCLTAFRPLMLDNSMLYFKILLRLGRANIELHNFADAHTIYLWLSKIRNILHKTYRIDIPNSDFIAMSLPFERHLRGSFENFQRANPNTSLSSMATLPARYRLGEDGYLHENPEVQGLYIETEYDDEDEDDDIDDEYGATGGTINLSHLCRHIYSKGTAPCHHPQFKLSPNGNVCSCGVEHDQCANEALEEEEDDDVPSSVDSDMPDLISGESESDEESDEESEEEKDDSLYHTALNDCFLNASPPCFDTNDLSCNEPSQNNHIESPSSPEYGNAPLRNSLAEALVQKRDAQSNLMVLRGQASSSDCGLRRGFLNKTWQADEKASPAPSKQGLASITPYETDEEEGPMNGDLFSEGKIEDSFAAFCSASAQLPEDPDWSGHGSCIKELFGKSFESTRNIDFSRLFGPHLVPSASVKRKKKFCNKKCGVCFARKMWKKRFPCSDISDAECFLSNLENDPRVDPRSFLSEELWQGTGYYGSGYELSFDIPALVHGVAYVALLQGELHWRGDSIPKERDVQQLFIRALEKIFKSRQSLNFLFMVLYLLRDTINIFDVFPDKQLQGISRSFQFANTAHEISQACWAAPSDLECETSVASRNVTFMTRTENCFQNSYNWSVLGHVAKEEEWVYKFLIRDVTDLLFTITTKVLISPKSHPRSETFSEAFQKACGDRDDDERYWKYRIVSAMSKQRSRMLERSSSLKDDGDRDHSLVLLSRAISARPNQARLFYKRGNVYFRLEKYEQCLNDTRQARLLLGEVATENQTLDLLDDAGRMLMLHIYMLEGETYSCLAEVPDVSKRTCLKEAQECFVKAARINTDNKRTASFLQGKLQELLSREAVCESSRGSPILKPSGKKENRKSGDCRKAVEVSNNKLGEKIGKRSKMSTPGNSLETKLSGPSREVVQSETISQDKADDTSSSSDDDENLVSGNRYSALVANAARVGVDRLRSDYQVGKMAIGSPSEVTPPRNVPRSASTHGSTEKKASSSMAERPTFRCRLCNVEVHSQVDYDCHMKGRRHRTAVERGRKVGALPKEGTTYLVEANVVGPTCEEVLNEVHRVMSVFGGEAHINDIISNMNFTRWNIDCPRSYIEAQFGSIQALCLGQPQTFEVRAGAERNALLTLVDGNDFVPVSRRKPPVLRGVPRSSQQNQRQRAKKNRSSNTSRTQSRTRARRGSKANVSHSSQQFSQLSTSLDFSEMVNDLLNPTGDVMNEDGIGSSKAMVECSICMDNPPDVRCLPCRHMWCEQCIIDNIARDRHDCPYCRGKIDHLERLGVD